MEIHAPEKPILTIKEATVQIMRSEIEENRHELDKELAHIKDKQMKEMTQGIEHMHALAAHQPSDTKMLIVYRGAKLHSAGQTTAQLMGAFAYMDYKEVSRWSEMYDLQAEFLRTQSAGLAEGTAAFSFLVKRDLLKTSPEQLEAEAENLRRAVGTLVLTMQMGTGLRAQYDKVLGEH